MPHLTILLDSDKATSSGGGVWAWLYPKGITLGPRGSHSKVGVTLFSAFNTVPNVTSTSNTLSLTVNDSATYEAVVAAGQYDSEGLITALAGQIGSVTISFDDATTKYTLTCPSPFTLSAASTLLQTMGFVADTLYTASLESDTGQYTLTSPLLIDLGGARYLEISTSLQTDNVVNEDSETGLVLARVPLITAYGSSLCYGGESTIFSTIKDHLITYLVVKINDDRGEPVDFSGVPWSMSLYLQPIENAWYQDLADTYQKRISSVQAQVNTPAPTTTNV
jgi:hypothetical protein